VNQAVVFSPDELEALGAAKQSFFEIKVG